MWTQWPCTAIRESPVLTWPGQDLSKPMAEAAGGADGWESTWRAGAKKKHAKLQAASGSTCTAV